MRRAALGLGLALPACAPTATHTPDPDLGRWHTSDGWIVAPDGRVAVLQGANVSSVHKQPPFFDFHEVADFERMKSEWGLGAARFLVSWTAIEPEEGVYDDGYLDQVAEHVGRAEAAGIDVVLDLHQDVYGEGFTGGNGAPRWTCAEEHYAAFTPASPWFLSYLDPEVVACYDGFWQSASLRGHYAEAARRLAARLAGSPAVIGLDVMNEPYWGSYDIFAFEADVLSPFYEELAPIVRAEAPDWLLFVEPSSSRNVGFATGLLPPSFERAVYAPHSYDRDAEGGAAFDPGHVPFVHQLLADLSAEAGTLGAALWVGEYGTLSSIGNADLYLATELDARQAVLAGGSYWHYGKDDGYGLLDAQGNEKPAIFATLVRPVPERVGGIPTAWSWDAAAGALSFSWTSNGLATDVRIPARLYASPPSVACTACVAEWNGDVLVAHALPGAEASLVVAP